MLINFRSLITQLIGLLTLCAIIKTAHAQFKILDSSSFRSSSQKGGRHDDSNITLVMIKTLDEATPETTDETTNMYEESSPSQPRGFMHSRHGDLTDAANDDKRIKVQIDLPDNITTIQRVGKLQEKALLINHKLIENSAQPKIYSRSVDHRPNYKSQIIRIQTLNPLIRSYTQTLPTKKPYRRTIDDNLIIDLAVAKTRRVNPEKYQFRKFKSRCRCEKIANCQKLQISIARCPQDQFMCCFW